MIVARKHREPHSNLYKHLRRLRRLLPKFALESAVARRWRGRHVVHEAPGGGRSGDTLGGLVIALRAGPFCAARGGRLRGGAATRFCGGCGGGCGTAAGEAPQGALPPATPAGSAAAAHRAPRQQHLARMLCSAPQQQRAALVARCVRGKGTAGSSSCGFHFRCLWKFLPELIRIDCCSTTPDTQNEHTQHTAV